MSFVKTILKSRIFRLFVSVCLLGYMAHRFGIATIGGSMRNADPLWLAAAVAMFVVSGTVGALQWGILLAFHDIRPGVYGTISRYFMGLFSTTCSRDLSAAMSSGSIRRQTFPGA